MNTGGQSFCRKKEKERERKGGGTEEGKKEGRKRYGKKGDGRKGRDKEKQRKKKEGRKKEEKERENILLIICTFMLTIDDMMFEMILWLHSVK